MNKHSQVTASFRLILEFQKNIDSNNCCSFLFIAFMEERIQISLLPFFHLRRCQSVLILIQFGFQLGCLDHLHLMWLMIFFVLNFLSFYSLFIPSVLIFFFFCLLLYWTFFGFHFIYLSDLMAIIVLCCFSGCFKFYSVYL